MNMSKVSNGEQMLSRVGTPYYMSPEIFNGEPYTTTSDLWSLGCIIYHCAALRPPFVADRFVALTPFFCIGRRGSHGHR